MYIYCCWNLLNWGIFKLIPWGKVKYCIKKWPNDRYDINVAEQIGSQIMEDLGGQRQTIQRSRNRVSMI